MKMPSVNEVTREQLISSFVAVLQRIGSHFEVGSFNLFTREARIADCDSQRETTANLILQFMSFGDGG